MRTTSTGIQAQPTRKRKPIVKPSFIIAAIAVLVAGMLLAQRGYRDRGGGDYYSEGVRTARDYPQRGAITPTWTNAPGFESDVLTFVRIEYGQGGFDVGRRGYGRRGGRGGWATDRPDSDLNLSYRLQQMTAMKVDPNGRMLRLTDEDLVDFPFIYIVEPGGLYFSDEEATALREYLLNGGFLWFDDFWGESEWANMEFEMRKVFPNRSFADMDLDHPLYRSVNQIKAKTQVPDVRTGTQSQWTGRTWERYDGEEVHHRAIFDDDGRLMVFATHNTDNGDGWEWEGDNLYYFREFSEKTAYPLAINVLYYVMTH